MPLHVCIVDDDKDTRDTLRFLFEEVEATIEEAADGEAALALLRTEAVPRVMLLDRLMPRMDGFGVLRALAQAPDIHQRTAILFMTAFHEPPDAPLAEILDVLGVETMTKPFDDIELLLTQVEQAWQQLQNTMSLE